MTAITVMTIEDRLSLDQRRLLARTLTDAVLVPEVGQVALAARAGFQVHFVERAAHRVAIGGVLAADHPADIILIDIAVMQAAWPMMVRTQVIANVYEALAEALETATPSPAWWVNFRMIEEGSWGSCGGTLSILDLLDSGVFTPERASEIRVAMASRDAA